MCSRRNYIVTKDEVYSYANDWLVPGVGRGLNGYSRNSKQMPSEIISRLE
jgi:hypothetical protein